MIRLKAPLSLTLVAALLGSAALSATAQTSAALASGVDPSTFDPAVRPQDDLYRHVSGTWMKNTPMPADKARIGALEQVYETTLNQLRGLIEEAAQRSGDADARKVGDLWASFMDEAGLEKLGVYPLAPALAAIDAVNDRTQLAALLGKLERMGVEGPIGMYIGQDDRNSTRYVPTLWQSGLGLPDRDYYLNQADAKFRDVRAKYQTYIATLLGLGGQKDSELLAAQVLALETAIARAQWSRVETRDPVKSYNRVELAALPKLAPVLDWNAYLAALGLAAKTPDVLVGQPSYMTGLSVLLQDTPIATWKAYAKMRLLNSYAPYLNKAFVDARFAFVGTALSGRTENPPRWKRAVTLVDQSIGEALGKVYVARYFPPAYKARMEELVTNLMTAYRQSIETLDWMGPETKKEAQAKLAKFSVKIGYPKRWIDYGVLEIRRDDLIGNIVRARNFEHERQLNKLGRPVDRDEWGMTPQTVNAYYNQALNEIVFPAAFLQPPNFNAAADDAVNYGAIGVVIGHEISHGFDDSGSQYDGDGNLRDWWTAQDRERFAAKTKALVAQYSAFVPVPGYTVNGELTLGENIADNSGLAIAWKAYHLSLGGTAAPVIDGLSGDRRFFLGFAQIWRSKQREEAMLSQIKSDGHSPDEFRVNGTVRNAPGFYSTFDVKPGDKLYLPPEQRVTIW